MCDFVLRNFLNNLAQTSQMSSVCRDLVKLKTAVSRPDLLCLQTSIKFIKFIDYKIGLVVRAVGRREISFFCREEVKRVFLASRESRKKSVESSLLFCRTIVCWRIGWH
jgi:hypothetical protein